LEHVSGICEMNNFDLTRFEESLNFPFNSYVLCSIDEGTKNNSIVEDTIDFIVSEFGCLNQEQADPCEFFAEELPEDRDSHCSPPVTRSRGPVRRLSNVQEKVLEYEHRTKALKRYHESK